MTRPGHTASKRQGQDWTGNQHCGRLGVSAEGACWSWEPLTAPHLACLPSPKASPKPTEAPLHSASLSEAQGARASLAEVLPCKEVSREC